MGKDITQDREKEKAVKCLVWDLDDTLWDGTLLVDHAVRLRPGVENVLKTLDDRGILLSIASKNYHDDAIAKLNEFGLTEYFLVPQIGWGSKAVSIDRIAKLLNLGLDAFAFIDDQPAEREEMLYHHPSVRVFSAADYLKLTDLPEFTPRFITDDSRLRRKMYSDDLKRSEQEESYKGSHEDFLKTLEMRLELLPVRLGDLERVEELTLRTNQLNSTGVTYSYDELKALIASPDHLFLTASLTDKFGSYGKIGLALAERNKSSMAIKLLLMSCRVMTRGIGSALLTYLINYCQDEGLSLSADFISTPRNRIMYITYKLMGFEEISREGDHALLRYRGSKRSMPDYLMMSADDKRLGSRV